MHRRLRVLGLALVAVFALAAVAAASASAFTSFERETTTTSFKGEQTEESSFTVGSLTISCTNGTFRGMTGGLKEATIETSASTAGPGIEYTRCTLSAVVKMHSCNYKFRAAGTFDIVANGTTAEQAECNANGITVEEFGCKVAIHPQTALGTVPYANAGVGANREVVVGGFGVPGITYTAIGCAVNGTFNNGAYQQGRTPMKGWTSTTFVTRAGIFIS
jgi:hypothetical protein